MTERTPRLSQPRRWASLALVGATASLATSSPGLAVQGLGLAALAPQSASSLVLIDSQGGEGGEAAGAAAQAEGQASTQAPSSAEGGEGGEAGATAGAAPDAAYLAQLSIVAGHLRAAVLLFEKGQKDDAVALSYHPEAEMMDSVRESLQAHGAADITPAMTTLSEAMEQDASLDTVKARLAEAEATIAAAQSVEADEIRTRFEALVVLVKAGASEYAGAIKDGAVEDPMAFLEAFAFLQIARDQAGALATLGDETAAKAAAKIDTALAGADAAFGDVRAAALVAQDPGLLMAIAGRVELAASQVR